MKARKTASFGVPYNYSQIEYPKRPLPMELSELAKRVKQRVGFLPNSCLLNYYPNGDSTMGFHSDTAMGRSTGTGVAIVSLGASREMAFKNKANRQETTMRRLVAGSLIYLDDVTQQEWLHAIPKTENSGPRISLSFRSVIED